LARRSVVRDLVGIVRREQNRQAPDCAEQVGRVAVRVAGGQLGLAVARQELSRAQVYAVPAEHCQERMPERVEVGV